MKPYGRRQRIFGESDIRHTSVKLLATFLGSAFVDAIARKLNLITVNLRPPYATLKSWSTVHA